MNETIGERIKRFRKERGLKQADISLKTNKTRSHLSQIENNRIKECEIGTLRAIANALGVSLSSLIDDTNPA